MKIKTKVKDIRKGYDNFRKNVDNFFRKKKMSLFLGFFDDEEQVMKATVHEFGLGNNPERRWLSRFADIHKKELTAIYGKAALRAIHPKRIFKAQSPAEVEESSEEIRQMLIEWVATDPLSPKLSKAWLARKQGPHQMKDTGAMLGD